MNKNMDTHSKTLRTRIGQHARSIINASDTPITGNRLRQAMTINIITGSGAMIFGMVSCPGNLFNVFIKNHLGASASDLGLLVAITQFSALFQLVSIIIYSKLHTRKIFWGICHVVHRMFAFVLAGVSFFAAQGSLSPGRGFKIVLGGIAISWLLTNIATTGWWTWQTDLYPEKIRATFFTRRSAIVNAVGMIWFFATMVVLDIFSGANILYVFAAIFTIAGVAGVADILFHLLIPEPRRKDIGKSTGLRDFFEPVRNRNFILYATGIGLWVFSANIGGPFIAPFVTDPSGIHAPNTWLGIMSTVTQIFWIITVPWWGRWMDRFGRKPLVILSAFAPLSWIVFVFMTNNNYYILIPLVAIIGGIWGPGFGEGNMQLMLTISPEQNRTAYIAWYTTLTGCIGAGGALTGGWLSDVLADVHYRAFDMVDLKSFHIVLLISITFTTLSVFIINMVREPGSRSIGHVVKKLTRPVTAGTVS